MYNQIGQSALLTAQADPAMQTVFAESAMQTVRPADGIIGPAIEAPQDQKDPCEECPTTIVKWRTKFVNVPGPVQTVTKKEIVYRDRPCPTSPPDSGGASAPVISPALPHGGGVIDFGVPDSGDEDEAAEGFTTLAAKSKFPWWLVVAAAGAGVYFVTRK